MTEDPREFGLAAADLRAAADRLYAPDDSRLDRIDWTHGTQVRYGLIRSHLRGLADAIEAPPAGGPPGLAAYTDQAVAAVTAAAAEHDFGGWLSLVLCRAAAELGSLDALTAGRPGSWEAEHVDALARGLAFDDEGLADYRAPGRR